MAHTVKFRVPERELDRSDVTFDVWMDEGKLGTLTVSKGSLVWFPSATTYGHRATWEQFDRLMTEHVRGKESR